MSLENRFGEREFKKGVLILEDQNDPQDRLEFSGLLFGAPASTALILQSLKTEKSQKAKDRTSDQAIDRGFGEVVFNTSMTGYQEILTDPSYYGQIICMTTPHIGNVGVNREDYESQHPWCAGFIAHEISFRASNWRSENELDNFLKENGVPGIFRVDTRALTRQLRKKGVVRGVILPEDEKDRAQTLLKELPKFEGRDLIQEVSTPQPYQWKSPSPGQKPFRVVAFDFGVKSNILRKLDEEGCEIQVVPAQTSADEVLALKPQGVFLSNGPGDPNAATYAIESVKGLLGRVPIFGICMGHQILSLALGGKAFKLKFGHRGANQPVKETATGRVEISSQNHGYAIDASSLPKNVKVSHIHLNDQTVAGLEAPEFNAFSVQYHPEASPGPHDSMLLFKRFVECIKNT